MARYLLLHGYQGVGPDHWLVWLSGELRARGHVARIRKLPSPNDPELGAWTATLRERLARLASATDLGERGDPTGPLVVVAHSLGARTWIHHAATFEAGMAVADRAVLVAPPALPEDSPITGFFDTDLTAVDMSVAAHETRMVVSGNDRFWPNSGSIAAIAEPLGLPVDHLGNAGHVEPGDGFGPWPGMLAWCLGEAPTVTR